jgi:recombination associated protein RdgC
MTSWLNQRHRLPTDFKLADACELMDLVQEGAVVNCKRQDLTAEEIHGHLEAGKSVTRLALQWNERLRFVIDDEFVVRRLQFLDIVQEQGGDSETYAQHFDTDFAIMTLELASLIKRLFEIFGKEDEEAYEQVRLSS